MLRVKIKFKWINLTIISETVYGKLINQANNKKNGAI